MKEFVFKNRKILVFTSVVVMFLVGIGVIQTIMKQAAPFEDTPVVKVEDNTKKQDEETQEETPVVETLKKPVSDDIQIIRYFYDPTYDDSKLEKALIYFEGVYRPNLGVDFSKNGDEFDVIASLSGKVTKKTNDPLLGWVVTVTSDNGITITYQSLSKVDVEENATIKQGDKIGVSGENVYESDLKKHLHFVLEKDNEPINPEPLFNQEVTKITQ